MGKKMEIREMASYIGNSAAHIALLPESEFAKKEVATYTEDAAEVAVTRTWNNEDIAEFKRLALQRAISEIKKRIERYGSQKSEFDEYLSRAQRYIKRFADEQMELSETKS